MLKQKIQNHEKLIGMYLHLNDVAIAKIAAISGYDYVWVDLEHSCLSLENLLASVMILRAHGTAVIVRVPQNDLTYTKKVLEMGVDGIIFPMVHSAEEAGERIASTLYPPYGTRGFVTDAIKDLDYTYFYTCGPEPMIKALYNATATSGQFSFEERMGCGLGACMGCSCKTLYGNKRICKDGPVLVKEEIIWEK